MSKEFLKQRNIPHTLGIGLLRAYAVILSFEVYFMLSVIERHQIERDSRAPYIYEALKREGLVDESTNTRNMSLREIYAYIKTNDVKIGGDNSPIIFVSRADVEYTFKKFEIKGRKAGRKIKSVKADADDDQRSTSASEDTTPVDTDSTTLESDHSEKSVSTVQVSVPEVEEEPEQISPIEQQANDLIFKYIESDYNFWHCCYWPTRRGSTEHRRVAENLLKRDGIYSPELHKTMVGLFQYITREVVPAVPPKQDIAA